MKILKFNFLLIGILLLGFSACKSSSSTVNTDMKAYLIDGTWEANYIMNTPKGFNELFPKGGPTINFNSKENQVNGHAGCNNFNGNVTIEGNNLSWGEGMAVTRKMCPEMSGEQAFLETLRKANTYSVTDQGKTLNLIMGDIAIMRLTRK